MYNPRNVGVAFVVMGVALFFMIAGEFAVKMFFVFLSFICIDYGLRLMARPPLLVMIKNWFDKVKR